MDPDRMWDLWWKWADQWHLDHFTLEGKAIERFEACDMAMVELPNLLLELEETKKGYRASRKEWRNHVCM